MSSLARQRSLVPMGRDYALEGWMDEDAATAAGQLFGSGPAGLLVIDGRDLLTSTARVVGAQLGEMHFKAWMAMITLHVAHGMPEDGRSSTSIGELAELVWGPGKVKGGSNTRKLVKALSELRQATFTVPGYDLVSQRPAAGVSDTSLLINLFIDETILRAYNADTRGLVDRAEIGREMGARGRDTIGWRLHPDYTQRLADSDLRRFDWSKAQQLRGVALALWMVFTSPRVPYRDLFASPSGEVTVELNLSTEHCHALGVRAARDTERRRTLNEAGQRVMAADKSFVAFEAHGGRGSQSFLRVVRERPTHAPTARPFGSPAAHEQLALSA